MLKVSEEDAGDVKDESGTEGSARHRADGKRLIILHQSIQALPKTEARPASHVLRMCVEVMLSAH
jgi:hypothetical protein